MELLYYSDLEYKKVNKQFIKTVEYLERADFNAAEVKKITGTALYRAKLDYENRLLFRYATYKNKQYLLLLEVIHNHEYNKSRFLRGANIDESKLQEVPSHEDLNGQDETILNYVNPSHNEFRLLDKVISFDDYQEEILKLKPPVIIIGSAGSGKTVLTLEKLKSLKGRVLYITLSPFLVDNSAKLYASENYDNDKQEVDFLSFADFCSTLKILKGKEMNQWNFGIWMQTRAHSLGIKDVHKLYEEFRGVLTGMEVEKPYLSRSDYMNLGVRRSIFLGNEREKVYDAFEKYLEFVSQNDYYDLNIKSFEYLKYCRELYDFVVIDEAQDFTNIQLFLILNTLKKKGSFILCGDSNQIVHPNFFSWTNVKSMFYKQDKLDHDIKILRVNYRNSISITNIANRLLKIKNARFGSIDKESTYLIEAVGDEDGDVTLLNDSDKTRRNLNQKTSRSTRFAVLVMRQEDKSDARRLFKTPLIFSIHESKGLEYENVIILNFISKYAREFNEIISNVEDRELEVDDIMYARHRDKADKSSEAYKFYINSLYVAITRGIKNIYLLEANQKHKMLQLLQLAEPGSEEKISTSVSSDEEWKQEAEKLEKQGKKEHADEIRKIFFSQEQPDWEPLVGQALEDLKNEALNPDHFNKKAKDKLFAYSVIYDDLEIMFDLAELKYRKAENKSIGRDHVTRKYYLHYKNGDLKKIAELVGKYGINHRDQFNLTPLLAAIVSDNEKSINYLLHQGADITLTDNRGRNALRSAISINTFRGSRSQVVDMVFGAFVSDVIKLKIDDKLVIIPSRKFEYIMLNVFLAIQEVYYTKEMLFDPRCIDTQAMSQAIYSLPEQMVPEFRKKRTYVSAMLSKNERTGNHPYNNKLLTRINRGQYMLNPDMEMLINEDWLNVYDVMGMEKHKEQRVEEKTKTLREIMSSHNFPDYLREAQKNLEYDTLDEEPDHIADSTADIKKSENKQHSSKKPNKDQLELPF